MTVPDPGGGGLAPGTERLPAEEPLRRTMVTNIGIDLVLVQGGEFLMGSGDGGKEERPPHPVEVSGFYLSATEVTQEQWRRVMPYNPSRFAECGECPVERVSWEQVQDFLRRAGSVSGVALRLPTEAEWEYAAGGGAVHQRWAGTDSEAELADYAWYETNSGERTRSAGTAKPNLFGLYDMSGNVWEWCADWYSESYYGVSPLRDPEGPEAGSARVLRGGSYGSGSGTARVSARMRRGPLGVSSSFGFRVAADAAEGEDGP